MQTLKTLILSKFKSFYLISMALGFSVIALMIRVKLNKSFFYIFLVWNVFLALIPYMITMYLNTKHSLNSLKLLIWVSVWILFLPNAPYIVTDLMHIRLGNSSLLWLDIIVVLSFASTGLLLFYLTIIDMQSVVATKYSRLPIKGLTYSIILLSGFGVYLGRFLRYNSWEIISQPQYLLSDIIAIIIRPFQHFDAWLFTLGFGGFLLVGFWIFKAIYYLKPTDP